LIKSSIEIEKELTNFEVRAKCRGKLLIDCEPYNKMREKLVSLISQINRVANSEGKGRDDLTSEILIEAESIMRRISSNQCKSVRVLSEKIKQNFMNFRLLMRKYDENIEIVDPQLKNNQDLVECLFNFESTWEKGKEFLLNNNKCNQLINFSQLIELLCEKYKELNEQIENRDPNIFVWIPSIVILKSIENDDKGICMEFNPYMYNEKDESGKTFIDLKNVYNLISKDFNDPYVLYNMLEKSLLFDEIQELEKGNKLYLSEFDKKIKILAMQLQRIKPLEWNNFIDLAMNFMQN